MFFSKTLYERAKRRFFTLGINDPEIAHQNVIVLLKPSYLQQSSIDWDEIFGDGLLHLALYFSYPESYHLRHFDVIVNCYNSRENPDQLQSF